MCVVLQQRSLKQRLGPSNVKARLGGGGNIPGGGGRGMRRGGGRGRGRGGGRGGAPAYVEMNGVQRGKKKKVFAVVIRLTQKLPHFFPGQA